MTNVNTYQTDAESSSSRPPSMADVAAVAGVSHQTVSRVLNDHPNVREGTRVRVLEAIKELGYRRNLAARALATAQTRTIGILTIGSEFFGPQSTVLAVEAAARAQGYFVTVTSMDSYDIGAAVTALNHLTDQSVDGVVVVAPHDQVTEAIDELKLKVPVVVVAARTNVLENDPVHYVYVDQRDGARQATEHLISLGHQKIVHVSGPTGWSDATERKIGWGETMAAAGYDAVEFPAESWLAPSGYDAGVSLAPRVKAGEITAVFASNDYLAIGLLRAFWEAGVSVPEDVSVVGFDDLQIAEFYIPKLTTVRQPFGDVGRAALAELLNDDPASSGPRMIAPTMIVRASTAPPARS